MIVYYYYYYFFTTKKIIAIPPQIHLVNKEKMIIKDPFPAIYITPPSSMAEQKSNSQASIKTWESNILIMLPLPLSE
jgi:hypothetical protein